MNDERKAGAAGYGNVRAKKIALNCAVRLVVIVIESGFADPDDAGMAGGLHQRRFAEIGMVVGLMRVNADAGPDVRLAFRGPDHGGPFALPGRDVEERPHPRLAGPREHGGLVLDQSFVVEMAMAIDQHQASAFSGSSRRGNTPVGVDSRKPVSQSRWNHDVSSSAAKFLSTGGRPI